MKEEIQPICKKIYLEKKRPYLLSALCIFSFVYFGILAILFLIAVLYSGTITEVIDNYAPGRIFTKMEVRMIFAGGFLLHLLGLTGSLMIWNLRKRGYPLLVAACLIITAFQLFRPDIALTTTAVYIILILLFGIFYKRLN